GETIYKNNGGGIYCSGSSLLLRNISIDTNEAIADGGGMYAWGSGSIPNLINASVSENKANNGGGLYSYRTSIKLTNVTISKNKALTNGGGIYDRNSFPTYTNLLVVKNVANSTGGGMYNDGAYSRLTNVTISSNVAEVDAGGMNNVLLTGYPSQIRNSIIWGNKTTSGTSSNVKNANGAPVYLRSLVEGETIVPNSIISNEDPLFVDTLNNDYHLTYCSPAINTGANSCYASSSSPDLSTIKVDLDSNARIYNSSMGGIVDLGAYEFQGERILPSLLASVKDTTICYGDTVDISLSLAGTAPWNFVYTKDYGITKDTLFISANSYLWKISHTDTTIYNFVKLYDNNCSITLSDSIQIKVLSKPTLTNVLTNEILCHGDTTTAITFSGTATGYEWTSNPQINNIPTGIQTGDFGEYKVENLTSSPDTTTIKVIPKIVNTITCFGDTSSFTIIVLPKPSLTNVLTNEILCHGDTTTAIEFAGTATGYKWTSNPQINNIPTAQTGNFGKYVMENLGGSPSTTTIKVIPQYVDGKTCSGDTSSFTITVLPNPSVTNIPDNDTLCYGEKTKSIKFAGTAIGYEWISSNSIDDSIPTGIQTGDFGEYTLKNTGTTHINTTITVSPKYVFNGKTCAGKDSSFSITAFPNPALTNTNIPTKDTLCHGTQTDSITFTGNANTYQWTSVPQIDNIPTANTGHFGKYTVINTTTSNTTTTITIVPKYVHNGYACDGNDANFTITVLPNPTVTNIFNNDTLCSGQKTTSVTFTGAESYQWESSILIDSIPSGTNNTATFGTYTVVNTTNALLIADIIVTPQRSYSGKICNGDDTSFKIIVLPQPAVTNILDNDTLCYHEKTKPITFIVTGSANLYEWENSNAIGNIPVGIQTGDFGEYTVTHSGTSHVTTKVTVTPKYNYNNFICQGKDTNFYITALPNPIVTNTFNDDTLCHGQKTTPITFTGTAVTHYQWESVPAKIDSIPSVDTGHFGEYTVINTTNTSLTTMINVTPQYILDSVICNGQAANFSITVNPLPVITNILDDTTLCDGDQTAQLIFAGAFTSWQWENTGDTVLGLPLGIQTDSNFGNYTVNNYTDSVITAIINIKAEYNKGAMCAMPNTNFKIRVNPMPKVDSLPSDTIILCSGSKTQTIIFSGVATSYDWKVRGDIIGLPSGPQTGDFGEYLLENRGNTPLTALVDVTPSYTEGGQTCLGTTYTFAITVNPIPEVEYVPADYALCSGDTTTNVTFGTAVRYEWAVSGDVIPGLPTGKTTGDFGKYLIENKTTAPLTAIITISPIYTTIGQNCTVKDTSFHITVNPEPFITNNTPNQILCSREQTSEIIFEGVFTNYEWQIDGNIAGIPSGVQTTDFGKYTVENRTTAPIAGTVSLDVYYTANGISCMKQDTLVLIIVNPEPTLINTLSDDTLCNGEKTTPIIFTGNATSYEWEVSGTIPGLPYNSQTGDFGAYTLTNNISSPLTATITITPIYSGAGIVCTGTAQQFNITVNPTTKIDSITANAFFFCEGEELRITVSASGGNLTYQWYYNGTPLSGEISEYYIVPKASRLNSGIYYVEISGVCGGVKSSSITIDVRDEKMLVEKWHDVILVDNSTYEFFGYQWYRNGIEIIGATEQFYQEIGGLKGCYSVELTLAGGAKIHSCERCVDKTVSKSLSIYPNPTKQGTPIKVNPGQDNNQTNVIRIEVYNTDGQLIMRKQINSNDTFEVETNNLSAGIYLLRIISTDEQIRNEKIVVY
ncbi:MAG: T9SS type A sorting domain-containing protein, partial [Bacteroidales bacterium]|nr:T9SS type A sorting domain-containing protein [Bacteroidales bacterium]